MSTRSLTWRRIGVGAVAVATVAAGSPLLLSSAASAAEPSRIVITQDNGRTSAAAGTCTAFTLTATDPLGSPSDAATFTVVIDEDPETGDHDVDFCVINDGTPFRTAPQYTNEAAPLATPPSNASTQFYDAGPSITTAPTDAGAPSDGSAQAGTEDNPDSPNDVEPIDDPQSDADNNNNPSGEDRASFSSTNGVVRFGVVGLKPGAAATIDAFYDPNGNVSRNNNPSATDSDTTDAGDDQVVAPQKRLVFTEGGRPGTLAAANAVRNVDIVETSSIAAKSSPTGAATHTFRVLLRNANGDLVGGVNTTRIVATAGPNAPTGTSSGTFQSSCTATGNEGEAAVCTYSPTQAGTDTVTAFVNQSTGSPTFGLDSTEPRDTATATTTEPSVPAGEARDLDLIPDSATISGGQAQDFTAVVTDINGAPATGVSVTFLENGPGTLVGGTAGSTGSTTKVAVTDAVGRATVRFTTATTETGSNVIFASITNPSSTRCQEAATATQPAGQCSDTSPVTITVATVSPSPSASASPSASPSASATPTATMSPTASPGTTEPGSRYRGLASPVRVLDTRLNSGQRRSGEIILDLSNRITDPNATAAVLNVTVTNGTRRGFLVAYPTGTPKPGTSNVNFETNQTQANEVVVRLSADRKVSLFVDSAAAHVIADLVGSFTTSTGTGIGEVTTNAPVRAFDSRNTATPTRRNEVVVDLTGRIPSGSTDAILNVTVTRTTARGFVTVFPTGTTRPGTSNVNFEANQTQANEVITKVGAGSNANKVSFFIDSASAALIVDVVGAVSSTTDGQTFTALASPQRALDTRDNRGSRRNGNINLVLPSSVPANATGVILNVTATNGSRPGFVTVFPGGSTNPGTSNVNFPTNLTQANEVTTGLGPNNDVTLFVGGANAPAAHVIVDVVGYLTD